MSIAQKLCDEIVEPALKLPSANTYSSSKKCLFHNPSSSSSRQRTSNTRTIIVQKRRTPSKLITRDELTSRTFIQPKPKNIEREIRIAPKNILIDAAVNTLVSGPLTCDTDCVTNVRKRSSVPANRSCSCKCSQKKLTNYKASVKEIQTHNNRNYLFTDKACSQIVDTVSCGTQFLETIGNACRQRREKCKSANKETMVALSSRQSHDLKIKKETPHCHMKPQQSNVKNSCSKRWALTQFPVHGPDF